MFRAPPAGSLTLTGVVGDVLSPDSENGVTGSFDVHRREYRLDP